MYLQIIKTVRKVSSTEMLYSLPLENMTFTGWLTAFMIQSTLYWCNEVAIRLSNAWQPEHAVAECQGQEARYCTGRAIMPQSIGRNKSKGSGN